MIRIIIAALLAGGLSLAALYGAHTYLDIGGAAPAGDLAVDPVADLADEDVVADQGDDLAGEQAGMPADEAATPEGASAPSGNFVHTAQTDYHGYYLPTAPLQTGDWMLRHIHIGHASQFAGFEESGENPDLVPVWIEFAHVDAETLISEEGFEYPSRSRRVRASRYHIGEVHFELAASDEEVGEVYVYGRLDADQIQGPVEGSTGVPALTGGAELNGERLGNLSFDHWYGH